MAEGYEPQPYVKDSKVNVTVTMAQGVTSYGTIARRIGNLVIVSGLIQTSAQTAQNATLFTLGINPLENYHVLLNNYDCIINNAGKVIANTTIPAGYYAFNASYLTN